MTDQISGKDDGIMKKNDTYHEQGALLGIATTAGWLSWVFLALSAVVGGVILYLVYLTATTRIAIEQFVLTLPTYLVPLFLGAFFWIVLRLISEGVYLLMDIEDNTRGTDKNPPEGNCHQQYSQS